MSIKLTLEIDIGPDQDPEIRAAANALLSLVMAAQADGRLELNSPTIEPPKRRKPPQRPPLEGTPSEQWATFIAGMPERTQRFVELMTECSPAALTQSEAMASLGIAAPKSIGGLTGSIRRWASADGLSLPWSAYKESGERVWLWHGFDDSGANIEPPSHLAEVDTKPAGPITYDEYFASLPDRSRRFLEYLERVGSSSVKAAMEALGISDAKALGGLTGSISRWGRAAGVQVPFTMTRIDGDRGYLWTGGDLDSPSEEQATTAY